MCDCPQKEDEKIVGKITKTVTTIFSRCPTPYRPGKDMLEYTALSGIDYTDNNDRIPINSIQSNSDVTICDSVKKSPSTESSSELSRTYKFVCPRKRNYVDEAEEGSFKLSPVCLGADEVDDTAEKSLSIECTLAIIKPEAVQYRKEIEYRIYTEGFEICQTRWLQLTPEQASEFYSDHYGELSFPHLVAYMSSRPIIVLVLAKKNAVKEWKIIMGPCTVNRARLYFPDSIRAKYGRRGDDFKNAVHGSDSREQAEKEIHFFFPNFIIEPLLSDQMAEDFLWEVINPVLVEGLTSCCRLKPSDPVLWLANWLILNNPNKPKLPEDLALNPT